MFVLTDIILTKGAFTYDIRFFRVIFDLPTNPSPILSDSELPTQYMISDFDQHTPPNLHIHLILLAETKCYQPKGHYF